MIPRFTVADRLRKARLMTGREIADFAEELDISRNTVTNYELGVTAPKFATVERWAAATDVPTYWLLWGYDDAPRDPVEPAGRQTLAAYREELRALRDSNPQPSGWEPVHALTALDAARERKISKAREVQIAVVRGGKIAA